MVPVLTAGHRASTGIDQGTCELCPWLLILSTDDSGFTLSPRDKRDRLQMLSWTWCSVHYDLLRRSPSLMFSGWTLMQLLAWVPGEYCKTLFWKVWTKRSFLLRCYDVWEAYWTSVLTNSLRFDPVSHSVVWSCPLTPSWSPHSWNPQIWSKSLGRKPCTQKTNTNE